MRNVSTAPEGEGANFRRFWILAVLSGVERGGASPIGLRHFNLMAYFANSVSRCYDIEPLDPTVLKERGGPLYPQLMWDLDRLVGMRLVRVVNLVIAAEGTARHVSYAITLEGLNHLKACTELSDEMKLVTNSLTSAALAYCRARRGISVDSMQTKDANISDPKFGNGDIVDFGEWDNYNATANAVDFVKSSVEPPFEKNTSIAVNLYAQYLAKAVEVAL